MIVTVMADNLLTLSFGSLVYVAVALDTGGVGPEPDSDRLAAGPMRVDVMC